MIDYTLTIFLPDFLGILQRHPRRFPRDLIGGTAISEASVAESLQRPGYVIKLASS